MGDRELAYLLLSACLLAAALIVAGAIALIWWKDIRRPRP